MPISNFFKNMRKSFSMKMNKRNFSLIKHIKKNTFPNVINVLIEKNHFHLEDYKHYLVQIISDSKDSNEKNIDTLVKDIILINLLKEKEFSYLFDYEKNEIKLECVKEIAQKLKFSEKEIIKMLNDYKESNSFHKWLLDLKLTNQFIPSDKNELIKEFDLYQKKISDKVKKDRELNTKNSESKKKFEERKVSDFHPCFTQDKIEVDLVFTSHPTMAFDLEGNSRKNKPTIYEEFDEIHHYVKNAQKILNETQMSNIKVNFSLWCGGDRDGNPFVTSEVTSRILDTIDKKWELDVREDSKEIHNFVKMFMDESWFSKEEQEQTKFLDQFDYSNLKNVRHEIYDTIRIMIDNQRYIISNCTSFVDIYIIEKLAKSIKKNINIVPLFEKYEHLEKSTSIMENAIKFNVYPQEKIEIMLAYSDNSKTGGVIDATLSLYLTQMNLDKKLSSLGKKALFFHGRGGTFPRGGGNDYRNFFFKVPNVALKEKLRITVQGERIYHEFGNDQKTLQTLNEINKAVKERLDSANIFEYDTSTLNSAKNISELTQKKYRSIVNNQEIIKFFINDTYQANLELLNCGCRPGKRMSKSKFLTINDIRMITWVFGWSSINFYLPWFLGYGQEFIDFITDNKDFYPWTILVPGIHRGISSSIVSNNLPKELLEEFLYVGGVYQMYEKKFHQEDPKTKLIEIIRKRGFVG